ncbi:MAG TPA: BTAD domain-containing putative transcriptional regulator, partial [Nakamurella sp.]
MVRVRVLGALEATVDVDGRDVVADLGGPRQRAVLALLLVGRGEVVSVDRLVEDLWNSEPPPRAIGALQAYVSHLRRALEPGRRPRTPATVLVSEPPGYAVRLPVDAVDAWRFEAMVRTAATVDDPEEARSTLEQALALWRGPAYAEAAGEVWAVAEAARLEGLRLIARERWCAAVLRTGAASDAVLAAELLTREHPLREEGWRLLALALYTSGQQSDALAALRRAREILAEEMGLDPGPVLVQLEADVLNQQLTIEPPQRSARGASALPGLPADPAGSVGGAGSVRAAADPAAGGARPDIAAAPMIAGTPADPAANLPMIDPAPPGRATRPIAGGELVGRDAELNALNAAAGDAADHGTLRVALLAGDPGAGKTTLLDRLAGDLVQLGWRVAVGRCPEAAGAPPAWAWVETLRSLTADIDPGPLAPALAPLLDERLAAAQQSDASFGRFLLQRAVSSYLTMAANHRPLAIVLDDLHRGDSETLALLGGLADTVTGVPLLLIGSYRPSEVNGELRDTMAGLAGHSPVRLLLGGLEPDQAARLIRTVSGVQPDEATLAAITDRTGGNPFY